MPYIRPREKPYAQVVRLLKGYDLHPAELSRVMGCSANTARRRLEHPEEFTLGELGRISRNAHIPIDEIREAWTL